MAEVNVKYVFGILNLVELEILVSKDFDSSEPKAIITPALASLPKGIFQVTWKLVAGQGASDPQFKEDGGIYLKFAPPLVTVTGSQRREDGFDFWDANIGSDVISANGLSYGIRGSVFLEANGARVEYELNETDFDVDPTIAVTPDPPPGRRVAAGPQNLS